MEQAQAAMVALVEVDLQILVELELLVKVTTVVQEQMAQAVQAVVARAVVVEQIMETFLEMVEAEQATITV